MHFLFGFSGRINRAKMWLFLLVAIVWTIVAEVVAIFGLHWSHYMQALQDFTKAGHPFGPAPQPIPDPITGNAWIAVGIIALLVLLLIVASFAVYVKRLHDRNKSAWWLLAYTGLPWLLNIFVWTTGPMHGGFPLGLFQGPMGMARGAAYVVCLLIALWVFIEFYFFRGTKGENRFGPDPLAK